MGEYLIRVRGRVSQDLTDTFPSLSADAAPEQTTLRGHLEDQAALAGVLSHLDMLGVEILEVRRLLPPANDG
ncbi:MULTISPECIES: hypothetical protein [unclassified Nocardioides]|uniref:hypothetical protein n=1 Tax=unclassified Nocardioides TaxID=2615069 RepID=UPI0036182173